MSSPDTSSYQSQSSSDPSRPFATVRMPIEEPIENVEDAVQKLQQCSSTELRRARQHHRRALESLRQGGYTALSESTKTRLIEHLRRNLKALNDALDPSSSSDHVTDQGSTNGTAKSLSFRVRDFLRQLW